MRGTSHMQGWIVAALTVVVASGAGAVPLAVSPLDPAFPLLDELQRRGELGDRLSPGVLAPTWDVGTDANAGRLYDAWQRARIAPDGLGAGLRPRVTLVGLTTDPARQLRPLYADVREGDAVDPFGRWRGVFAGRAVFHPRITAGVHFSFDSRGDNDPRNRTQTFEQLEASNNFDAAWLRFGFDSGGLTLGRVPMRWGPERHGGLLIDDFGPAVDALHGFLRWGPHVLQAFAGQLSSETVDGEVARRWMYGHRADLYFLDDRLRLGLSETVVAAGPGESLNLRYLNPIPLWAQIQAEADGDASVQVNAIDAVDATWVHDVGRWRTRWTGSLAVDDLQISSEGRDRDPDQLAWTAGVDLSRDAWLFGYEYRRIGTWTYLHRGRGSDHTHFGRPLGAPEGPDVDRHVLTADWRPAVAWHLFAGGERRRNGENSIVTADARRGEVGRPFPRRTVEKRWIATAGIAWHRPGTAKAALQAAFHSISDVNNVPGVDEDVFELRIVIDLLAPPLRYAVPD